MVYRTQESVNYRVEKGAHVGLYTAWFESDAKSLVYTRDEFFAIIHSFRMGKREVNEYYKQKKNGFVGTLVLSGRTSRKTDRQGAIDAIEYIRKEIPGFDGIRPVEKEPGYKETTIALPAVHLECQYQVVKNGCEPTADGWKDHVHLNIDKDEHIRARQRKVGEWEDCVVKKEGKGDKPTVTKPTDAQTYWENLSAPIVAVIAKGWEYQNTPPGEYPDDDKWLKDRPHFRKGVWCWQRHVGGKAGPFCTGPFIRAMETDEMSWMSFPFHVPD